MKKDSNEKEVFKFKELIQKEKKISRYIPIYLMLELDQIVLKIF